MFKIQRSFDEDTFEIVYQSQIICNLILIYLG
jgi:hypothetical protein